MYHVSFPSVFEGNLASTDWKSDRASSFVVSRGVVVSAMFRDLAIGAVFNETFAQTMSRVVVFAIESEMQFRNVGTGAMNRPARGRWVEYPTKLGSSET